jgi:hypothetical protein
VKGTVLRCRSAVSPAIGGIQYSGRHPTTAKRKAQRTSQRNFRAVDFPSTYADLFDDDLDAVATALHGHYADRSEQTG